MYFPVSSTSVLFYTFAAFRLCVILIANHTFRSCKSLATDDCLASVYLIRCHGCFTALTPFIHIKVKHWEYVVVFFCLMSIIQWKYTVWRKNWMISYRLSTPLVEKHMVLCQSSIFISNVILIFFEKEWHALDKNSLTDGLWLCYSFTNSRRHHTTDCV